MNDDAMSGSGGGEEGFVYAGGVAGITARRLAGAIAGRVGCAGVIGRPWGMGAAEGAGGRRLPIVFATGTAGRSPVLCFAPEG